MSVIAISSISAISLTLLSNDILLMLLNSVD